MQPRIQQMQKMAQNARGYDSKSRKLEVPAPIHFEISEFFWASKQP
jgi:hypothetical protein